MCDFRISRINAAQKIFPYTNLHCCLFHYRKAIWINFKKYEFCGKGTYNDNSELLFSLQLLCFINKDKADRMFSKIKKNIKIVII